MGTGSSTSGYLYTFLPLVLLFVCLWFFMLRPQKKRDNETKKMRNSLQEGDEIVTIGGIIGKVLSVKEDSIVIYVGADKTKMEFKKWAVSEVTKKSDKVPKEPVKTETEPEETPKKKIRKLTKKSDKEDIESIVDGE